MNMIYGRKNMFLLANSDPKLRQNRLATAGKFAQKACLKVRNSNKWFQMVSICQHVSTLSQIVSFFFFKGPSSNPIENMPIFLLSLLSLVPATTTTSHQHIFQSSWGNGVGGPQDYLIDHCPVLDYPPPFWIVKQRFFCHKAIVHLC